MAAVVPAGLSHAAPRLKTIPSSGERIGAIGMGSWQTFDVGGDPMRMTQRLDVLRAFFDGGGGLIDSSPMYGTSEDVIGWCLARLPRKTPLFAATKVWTPFDARAADQMRNSEHLWGTKRFDLVQVHNLLAWEAHLETLTAWKAQGRIRYIGVTTSHGRKHAELERIMTAYPLDFVQLTYNIQDREAERRLLPLAAEKGIAVIANRPFDHGGLFDRAARAPIPAWAGEIGAVNWAQVFLKFIVSHPAVACAIPATSRADHMAENMGAALGSMPDSRLRARMASDFDAI